MDNLENALESDKNSAGGFYSAPARLLPSLLGKPALLLIWLTRSWLALAFLLAAASLTPVYAPKALDYLLEAYYQPVTKKVLGIIPVTKKNPELDARKKEARYALWFGSGGLAVLLYYLAIPGAVRKGALLAVEKARRADALAQTDAARSLQLYRSALGLAAGESLRKAIQEKMRVLGEGSASERTVALADFEEAGRGLSGRYETIRELGRGAFGVVTLARDKVLEREVAVKELPPHVAADPELMARFRKEARVLAKLNHPGIVQVYDFAETGPRAWIVMEYVPGEELDHAIKNSGPLEWRHALGLAASMAEALGYAHGRGVLHRDMKPSNVIIAPDGAPKIADFGVARLAASGGHTQAGAILGSPAYMSPEQASGGETGPRSDIYALGITLYKMLSGRLPFEGDPASVIARALTQKPPPLSDFVPGIPGRVEAAVMSMLEKSPDERPASMEIVAARLREAAAEVSG